MTETSIAVGLVDHFGFNDIESDQRTAELALASSRGRAAPRDVLAALLTLRAPSPIDPVAMETLDTLLAHEARERVIVSPSDLPAHAQLHPSVVDPLFRNVRLWRGDLRNLGADVIVNAANDMMLGCFIPGHLCIDNVLHAAAGPRLRGECAVHMERQRHREPTGAATLTGAHHLAARWVAHTVGPIVENRKPTIEDATHLGSSYTSILDAAHERGADSVGFCSVSTGVFGYPKPDAARVSLDAISRWLDNHPESDLAIVISAYTDQDLRVLQQAAQHRTVA